MSPHGYTWGEWGHPWYGTSISYQKIPLSAYEHRIEQEPYTEGLPKSGFEQGYALPHQADRKALRAWASKGLKAGLANAKAKPGEAA